MAFSSDYLNNFSAYPPGSGDTPGYAVPAWEWDAGGPRVSDGEWSSSLKIQQEPDFAPRVNPYTDSAGVKPLVDRITVTAIMPEPVEPTFMPGVGEEVVITYLADRCYFKTVKTRTDVRLYLVSGGQTTEITPEIAELLMARLQP